MNHVIRAIATIGAIILVRREQKQQARKRR